MGQNLRRHSFSRLYKCRALWDPELLQAPHSPHPSLGPCLLIEDHENYLIEALQDNAHTPLGSIPSLLLSTRPITKFESQQSMDDKMLSFLKEEKDYTLKRLQDMSNMCQQEMGQHTWGGIIRC